MQELNLGLKVERKIVVKLEKLKEVCEEAILDNELDTKVRKCIVEMLEEELLLEKNKV